MLHRTIVGDCFFSMALGRGGRKVSVWHGIGRAVVCRRTVHLQGLYIALPRQENTDFRKLLHAANCWLKVES